MFTPPIDPDSYSELMKTLEKQEGEMVELCFKHIQLRAEFTMANMFGWGVARRSSAMINGFRSLIEQKNSLCALPLVRMQLDNALRLYAGFFAKNHIDFCKEVFAGGRIDRMKTKEGHKMTDKYLVQRMAKRYAWITGVYETTSGFIHLSGKHMHEVLMRDDQGISLKIGPNDWDREPHHFIEPMMCMRHLNAILHHALDDWFTRMCEPDGRVILHPDIVAKSHTGATG